MVVLAAAIALIGCSSVQVRTDYDRDTDFSQYGSFGWAEDRSDGGVRSLHDARIRSAVERTLTARGYTVTDRRPDALLTYHAAVQRQVAVSPRPFRSRWGGADVRSWPEGTLVIEVVDPSLRQIVWRGVARSVLDRSDDPVARIEEAVHEIFEKYPPR
jgi:hypothetical protein